MSKSRQRAQTIADLVSVAVAIWFMAASTFNDLPAKSALNSVAVLVIGLSLWRIWRRHRKGSDE